VQTTNTELFADEMPAPGGGSVPFLTTKDGRVFEIDNHEDWEEKSVFVL
jgi:hypothetical protein